ncbi:MAG TPA: hypothetical protein DCS30_06400 [Rhizobiales bacterium]|nr:hypothetical protein [Hyphomicrobiales bacterium]
MQIFSLSLSRMTKLFSLKQGITIATAIFGTMIISLVHVSSAQALSFAPGTEFLPYKNQRACLRNGGNFLRWNGETYCTRAKKRPVPRPKISSYRSCVKAGGKIVKARPRICLWKGRYFPQNVAKPKRDSKPIIIRNFRECASYGGRVKKSKPPRCIILGRTYHKQGKFRIQPIKTY